MFEQLNAQQRAAAEFGDGPLLVLAGAGTGKTTTLGCRVAALLRRGVAPERILLLTFTRRAAAAMLARAGDADRRRVVSGTFHAVGNRLLRRYGHALGLDPGFGILDQSDAADLLDLVRDDLGLAAPPVNGDHGAAQGTPARHTRFPRKGTLASIYSRTVNARAPLTEVLEQHYPWCRPHAAAIGELFRAYTQRKRARGLLDYDDLLLWWHVLVATPGVGERVAAAFDHVLVDEYQDTNTLQADILRALCAPHGNLTVVGDDAQAIYGFRAATVDNILAFGAQFPGATVIRLQQNYRSTQPILDCANAVMAGAERQYAKTLWSSRRGGPRPRLYTCYDEAEQSDRVCRTVLDRREQGVPLAAQAVLFRAGHHSAHLEVELARRGIPFHKYGGLKFLEAAHVKDLLAVLRLLDNPDDELGWFRILQRLEGIGPQTARKLMRALGVGEGDVAVGRLAGGLPGMPAAAAEDLAGLSAALTDCVGAALDVAGQVERISRWYRPLCERLHDDADARMADLDQLALVAAGFGSRGRFVDELVLDPPNSTGDLAGPPHLDEDYLVLSTIHSAKGLEWDAVQLLHAADGMIPSDMATGRPEDVAEERRLLYVALTRARQELDVYVPLRYYHQRFGLRDSHSYGQISRFLAGAVRDTFERVGPSGPEPAPSGAAVGPGASVEALLDGLWG